MTRPLTPDDVQAIREAKNYAAAAQALGIGHRRARAIRSAPTLEAALRRAGVGQEAAPRPPGQRRPRPRASTPAGRQTLEEGLDDIVGGEEGKALPPDLRRTPNYTEATRLYLTNRFYVMPNTPDMYVSYMCALKKGFTGTPVAWFSICARDYWEGRQRNMFQEVSGYVPSNALRVDGSDGEGSGAVESDGSEDDSDDDE